MVELNAREFDMQLTGVDLREIDEFLVHPNCGRRGRGLGAASAVAMCLVRQIRMGTRAGSET